MRLIDEDLDFLFHMFFLARYCKLLEENSFRGRTANFLYSPLPIYHGLYDKEHQVKLGYATEMLVEELAVVGLLYDEVALQNVLNMTADGTKEEREMWRRKDCLERRSYKEAGFLREVAEIICAIVTCVFATVCSVVGAITGGVIGLATESGLFRGAGIGAISGFPFGIRTILVYGAFSMWLVREKVGPAVQSAVQSQMSAVDAPFIEVLDIFETGGTGGMSKDSVNKLEKSKISKQNNGDDFGEKI
ncbi:uncharacterized protein A4U43_C05F4220 [Asparagus officinalis]|uniref:Uncharacterized protein n=1 Tax=Asparagus officinalis TaxID=4686 RepID=A0A5P1ESY0_ASPOF|nr:uncharacterized protein A4U43_C05F4220 [Asparagus officinalis]